MILNKLKHMKLTWIKWRTLFLLLMLGMVGCYDFSKFENLAVEPFSPKLVVPVVNSTITFKELAEHEDANTIVIQKPGDSRFYLAFRDTIEVGDAAPVFTTTSVAYDTNLQLDAGELPPLPVPAGQTFGPITENFTETYSPITAAELKSIRLTQGVLNCVITNNFQNQISGTLTLTSLRDAQNNPVVLSIPTINPLSTSIFTVDLAGHALSLYNSTIPAYNTFSFSATITITSLGNPITTSDNANIQLSLNNLDFSYLIGKINRTIALADHDYKVDIFRSSYLADQHFDEPKLTFQLLNGYGIPFSFNINNFEVSNTTSLETVYLTNDPTPPAGSLLIGSPNQINFVQNIGDNDASTTLELNKNNSNIENMFDIAPNQFKMRSSITLGDATDNHDYFVAKDANLSVISEIELPLVGWVETNQINDTIVDIELPDLEKELNLKENDSLKITIKFKFNNNIPLDTYFQAYFLNDLDQELTRLFNEQLWLIKSATVDPTTGKATSPTVNYSEIIINRSKYSLMKDSKKIVLQLRFKTGGNPNQSVVIENTNSIGVQMSIIAEGTVNLDI